MDGPTGQTGYDNEMNFMGKRNGKLTNRNKLQLKVVKKGQVVQRMAKSAKNKFASQPASRTQSILIQNVDTNESPCNQPKVVAQYPVQPLSAKNKNATNAWSRTQSIAGS